MGVQQTATVTLILTIHGALTITTTTLPEGTVGQPYAISMIAQGGKPPYTFSATGLPAGLTISATGTIAGVPTVSGAFSVAVTVKEAG